MSTAGNAAPDRLLAALRNVETLKRVGRVAEARGTLIRASGVNVRVGEVCELREPDGRPVLTAEVVGIERGATLLAPLGTFEGVSADMEVLSKGTRPTVGVGSELLGRTIDALGNALDGQAVPAGLIRAPVYREPPNPMARLPSRTPFQTGVKALDTVAQPLREGQRVGVYATTSRNRSALLGMLARSAAEVNVIVLLGERGREARELIDSTLGVDALRKSVVVVATLDRPAVERARAAYAGTAIAEYFRDQGKRVLLVIDSVSRFARALREVALAVGEPSVRGGYPPSVFAALPRLFERAGLNDRGSITAFYTMLLEGEGNDPIGEEVRSLLDLNLTEPVSTP
jgi:type III secretion protein N (ATPase)